MPRLGEMKIPDFPEPLEGMVAAPYMLSNRVVNEFEEAISHCGETEIHELLSRHPELLRDVLENTGHHGLWFCNKPNVRPRLTNGKPGKIPDMILAGQSSLGVDWFIVELKSPQQRLFNLSGYQFSGDANAGLNQLLIYVTYANRNQAFFRDTLEIREFHSPKGILIIGKGDETADNDAKGELKGAWNNNMNNIKILSYSHILASARQRLSFQGGRA